MIRRLRPVVACLGVGVVALALAIAAADAPPSTFPATLPAAPPTTQPSTRPSAIGFDVLGRETCEGLGACQGASMHDGFVYLYGDLYLKDHQSGPGNIRQYRLLSDDAGAPRLEYTGLEILLTRGGQTLINHPTGLTWNPTYGLYLGNTVTKTKKGTIYHLNWTQMVVDRTLDHAVLNVVDDDLAVQGCRPEFVRQGDRWLVATADYGQARNAVRLYDPVLLATAKATSETGVFVEEFPCTAWVQQLHWIDASGTLIIAQNQIEGRRWRITPAHPFDAAAPTDFRLLAPCDDLTYPTELEGFCMIDARRCILVSSSRENNVTFARLKLAAIP